MNSHIPLYKNASYSNHNPTDDRKLLLNKREINKLIGKINREGFTIIPTKIYFKKGKAKIEIAVAKGKNNTIKDKLKKIKIGREIKLDMLEKQANTVFLGIGSNLGNKKNNINKAKLFLQEKNNLIYREIFKFL